MGTQHWRNVGDLVARLIEIECGRSLAVRATGNANRTIELSTDPTLGDHEEAYRLEVGPDRVTMIGATTAGVHYAAQTFVSRLQSQDGAMIVPAGIIDDWPSTDNRAMLVDPARHFIPVSELETIIDRMARAKLNLLHLHLLDSQSYALESEVYPELGRDPETGEERPVYSHEEIAGLVEYAAARNVDLMPELDLPGHATHLIHTFPDVQCTAGGDTSDWTVCVGAEASYDLLEDLVAEVVDLFPYPVVHIGGDEYAHGGVSWADCSVCRERMDREGFDRPRELYYYFLRRAHEILADHDRRMMMWNDQIDIADPPSVPDDILIDFWTIMRPELGPAEGCSMDGFLEEGFETCNSYSPATYMSHWADHELFKAWAPTQLPTLSSGNEERLWGGKLNMWNGPRWEAAACRAYHRRQLPATIPIFGDRVWHGGDPIDEADLPDAVARHALGPAFRNGGHIYEDLGGVLCPNDLEERAHVYRSLAGRSVEEAIEAYKGVLETLRTSRDAGELVFPSTGDAYIDCFEWLIEVAQREGRGYRERPE